MNRFVVTIASIVILTASCKQASVATSDVQWADGNATGQLKGFAIIRNQIGGQLFEGRGRPFPLDQMLLNKVTRQNIEKARGGGFDIFEDNGSGGPAPENLPNGFNFFQTQGLVSFLGGFTEDLAYSKRQNSQPNAINMMLWHVVMFNLAGDLAEVCVDGRGSVLSHSLQRDFAPILQKVCDEVKTGRPSTEAMTALFNKVMNYQPYTDAELAAWLADFGRAAQDREPKAIKKHIQQMLYSMFMNPFFLLES
jgi:hypothetical protein